MNEKFKYFMMDYWKFIVVLIIFVIYVIFSINKINDNKNQISDSVVNENENISSLNKIEK